MAAKAQSEATQAPERGNGTRPVPRIVPTRDRIKALVGMWELEGRSVRLMEERHSGVLLALNDRGERVNPLRVITRGRKVEDALAD